MKRDLAIGVVVGGVISLVILASCPTNNVPSYQGVGNGPPNTVGGCHVVCEENTGGSPPWDAGGCPSGKHLVIYGCGTDEDGG